jgi:hypothetical protein
MPDLARDDKLAAGDSRQARRAKDDVDAGTIEQRFGGRHDRLELASP